MLGYIYKIEDDYNKVLYVGSTEDFNRRIGDHEQKYIYSNRNLYKFLRDNYIILELIVIKEIEVEDNKELKKIEQQYIRELEPIYNINCACVDDERKEELKEYRRNYQQEHRKEFREYSKKHYHKNKAKYRELHKEYYNKNIDNMKEQQKIYYHKNKERIREYQKEYEAKNKDKIKTRKQQYYKKNLERIRKVKREYNKKNKERIREYQKEYEAQNKDKIRQRKQQYYIKVKDRRKEYYLKNKERIERKFNCICGSNIIWRSRKKHEKTKKHIKFIENSKQIINNYNSCIIINKN